MREKLKKLINDKFGSTGGSEELWELRQEIMQNTLDRYDDEIANGASESEAYEAAAASLEDMDELLPSFKPPKEKKSISLTIAWIVFGLLGAAVIYLAIKTEDFFYGFIIAAIGLAGVALTAYGVISLILGKRKKAGSIVCIAIGGQVLIYVLFLLFASILSTISGMRTINYDYTDKLANVSSISVIEVKETGYYEDEFRYEVKKSFAPEEWEKVLEEVSELDYVMPVNDPPTWSSGCTMIMIRFDPSVDGVTFVLIGRENPCIAEREGSRIRISSYLYWLKEYDDWNALCGELGIN